MLYEPMTVVPVKRSSERISQTVSRIFQGLGFSFGGVPFQGFWGYVFGIHSFGSRLHLNFRCTYSRSSDLPVFVEYYQIANAHHGVELNIQLTDHKRPVQGSKEPV